jgi:hypothetical protein
VQYLFQLYTVCSQGLIPSPIDTNISINLFSASDFIILITSPITSSIVMFHRPSHIAASILQYQLSFNEFKEVPARRMDI